MSNILSEVYPDFWKENIKGFKKYLKLEKGLSENSISAYIRDLRKLIDFMMINYPELTPEQYSEKMLHQFVEDLGSKISATSSQARIISGIRSFYSYLLLEDRLNDDPTEYIDKPRVNQKLPVVLSIEEIENLLTQIDLSKAEGYRNKAIIETLYSCGLRVSELISIKMNDLYFEEHYIKIKGKGKKERIVPVGKNAQKAVNEYLEYGRKNLDIDVRSAEYLFLSRKGKQLTRVTIFTLVKEIAESSGLNKNISPHTFRHSFATHLVEGGADIRFVQMMLGHESITTTEIYAHLDKDYLRSAIIEHHPRS
jgi:integrase/recombinase XerD